jgi:hypothetical protein
MTEIDTILQILVAKAQNRQVAKGPILGSLLTWLLYSIENLQGE